MILTLYYMYATFLQWWRLGALKNKLSVTLNSQNALLVCQENVIFDCRKQRSLENLLFKHGTRVGCTIVPKQKINLAAQWVNFPKDFKYFPIHFKSRKPKIASPNIYVLVHAVLNTYTKHQSEILQVENFGELLAWKVTDCFETILRTDIDKLTKLVNCFSLHDCDINHELQLLKIETVDVEGKVKKIKFERQFSLDSTLKYSHVPLHWKKFVADLKAIYSKVRDATNPKITIENGTSAKKVEEPKKVPVSEVKPIKKDKKLDDKHTLEVDYRRHKKDKEKKEKNKKEEKQTAKEIDETKIIKEHKHHKEKNGSSGTTKEHKKEKPNATEEDITEYKKHKTNYKIKKQDNDETVHKKHKTNGYEKASTSKKLKSNVARSSSKDKKLVKSEAIVLDDSNVIEESPDRPTVLETAKETWQLSVPAVAKAVKPPNVLVYADSVDAKDNVKATLATIINSEKYLIYDFPVNQTAWYDSTVLVVICGTVPPNLVFHILQYLLNGGQLFCLCSDFLYSVLHTFTTAEVREHELVRFSYGKWEKVKMIHHIFCYQASPAKKQFSKDSDASTQSSGNGSSPIAPRTPSTVDIQHNGKTYTIQVQVLGTEETWETPSLLLANVKDSAGRAIFSQVHLEINPDQYEDDKLKFDALKESNEARLQILEDILSHYLDIDCAPPEVVTYNPAYFLGRHDLKTRLVSECESIKDGKLTMPDLNVVFCGKEDKYETPSKTYLPVLIHACPSNFSTVNYFETLETEHIGRLVLYSDVLSSSQIIVDNTKLGNGFVVILRKQTHGHGRSNNAWISPLGSAPFSLQIHIPLESKLGRTLPLVQHIVMVAVISAVKKLVNTEEINIAIKWPNDLYANGNIKIGGIVVKTFTSDGDAIVNIGCGVNLNNTNPTTCINNLIEQYNAKSKSHKIKPIAYETYFATVFNELEKIIKIYQNGDVDYFFDLYYRYWLHTDAKVSITSTNNISQLVKIAGIDEYGFLKVTDSNGDTISVQPDGNSFDMMKGLISPKCIY